MKGRSKLGAKRGLTRNQKRKAAYNARVSAEGDNRKNKKSPVSQVRLVGFRVHRNPCGNVACRKCYVHVQGQGIYPRISCTWSVRGLIRSGSISSAMSQSYKIARV